MAVARRRRWYRRGPTAVKLRRGPRSRPPESRPPELLRPEDLRAVTAAIDQSLRHPQVPEPRYRHVSLAPATLALALMLLLSEALLTHGLLRRLP